MGDSYGGYLTIHVARLWQNDPERDPKNFKANALNDLAIIGDRPHPIVAFILKNINAPTIIPEARPCFVPHPIAPGRVWKDEIVTSLQTSDKEKERGLQACGEKSRLGTAVGLVNVLEAVRNEDFPGFEVPFRVSHGSDDFGVPVADTEYLLENAASKERKVNIIEGGKCIQCVYM